MVLARFFPVLRTFAPFLAGAADMPYIRFFAFNVVGGVAWVTSKPPAHSLREKGSSVAYPPPP